MSICSKSHSQHRNVQFHRETKLIDFCCSTTSNKKKEYREQKAPLLLNHTVGQSTLSNQSHIFWLTYLSVVIKHTVANFSTPITHCDLKRAVSTWIILLKMAYLKVPIMIANLTVSIKICIDNSSSWPGAKKSTLKSLIDEQTGINEQGWKKVPPCLLIY